VAVRAWLFTIMRNNFSTEYRKSKRRVQDEDDRITETLAIPPGQIAIAEDASPRRHAECVVALQQAACPARLCLHAKHPGLRPGCAEKET
jgi:DNA-directed RNA polymerase specialized sigma24 family protein